MTVLWRIANTIHKAMVFAVQCNHGPTLTAITLDAQRSYDLARSAWTNSSCLELMPASISLRILLEDPTSSLLPPLQVPKFDRLVGTAGGQHPAIGIESQREHFVVMS